MNNPRGARPEREASAALAPSILVTIVMSAAYAPGCPRRRRQWPQQARAAEQRTAITRLPQVTHGQSPVGRRLDAVNQTSCLVFVFHPELAAHLAMMTIQRLADI